MWVEVEDMSLASGVAESSVKVDKDLPASSFTAGTALKGTHPASLTAAQGKPNVSEQQLQFSTGGWSPANQGRHFFENAKKKPSPQLTCRVWAGCRTRKSDVPSGGTDSD